MEEKKSIIRGDIYIKNKEEIILVQNIPRNINYIIQDIMVDWEKENYQSFDFEKLKDSEKIIFNTATNMLNQLSYLNQSGYKYVTNVIGNVIGEINENKYFDLFSIEGNFLITSDDWYSVRENKEIPSIIAKFKRKETAS